MNVSLLVTAAGKEDVDTAVLKPETGNHNDPWFFTSKRVRDQVWLAYQEAGKVSRICF